MVHSVPYHLVQRSVFIFIFKLWNSSRAGVARRAESALEIYTDGSFKEGRGSWSFVVVRDGVLLQQGSGMSNKTTCTRMEFRAAIEALRTLPPGTTATIFSDSRVLVDTMTLWLSDWKLNGWVKKAGQPIPSVDQVQELDFLNQQHTIAWKWIKAHSGIVFNEYCDQLCIRARMKK